MPDDLVDVEGPVGAPRARPKSQPAERTVIPPESVNWHLWPRCNYACQFCFATFSGRTATLPLGDALRIPPLLRSAGTQKLTFAGGEPTLHPHLSQLLRASKAAGLTTMVVTNGSVLSAGYLERIRGSVDWIALSVDSASNDVEKTLGRGWGDHVDRVVLAAKLVKDAGIRLKVNTVVTAMTWQEDMRMLIHRLEPERWKVFQALRIAGENDAQDNEMWVTPEQFEGFLARHAELNPIGEDNDAMTGSYVMMDPLGRFFQNLGGAYGHSRSILQVGVFPALGEVGWNAEKYVARGGRYDWGSTQPEGKRGGL